MGVLFEKIFCGGDMRMFRHRVIIGLILVFFGLSAVLISRAYSGEVSEEIVEQNLERPSQVSNENYGSENETMPEDSGNSETSMSGRSGNAFVSPAARRKIFRKVAIIPFRAPVELVGASVADMFATGILRTYKYQLVERSQMERVLGEQALGLKGVTSSATAIKIGKLLGAQGVIIGTIPEYGYRAVGSQKLPSIGLNIRMIDVTDGTIVWSITNSGLAKTASSLSGFAERIIRKTISQLMREMIRAGDTLAVNLPSPQVVSHKGKIRAVVIQVLADSPRTFRGYKLLRSRSARGPFRVVTSRRNTGEQKMITLTDRNLLDAETYYYKVAAVARGGFNGSPAGPFKVTTAGPPGAVQNLSAKSGLIRKVVLRWQSERDSNVHGYFIYRKTPNSNWQKIANIEERSQNNYVDEELKDGTRYLYRIVALNTVNVESPPSPSVAAVTKGRPAQVKGFSAVSKQPRRIPLTWEAVREPEVKGYIIYRAEKKTGPFEEIEAVEEKSTTKYTDEGDDGLKDNTRYYYKIHAINVVDVHSRDSRIVSAITKPLPVAVAGLRASQLEPRRVALRWKSNPEPDIAAYEIFRSTESPDDFGDIVKLSGNDLHYVDKDREDGTTYYYKVRAIDKDGLIGKFSKTVASRTKPIPKTPQGLKARTEGTRVVLQWQPNPEPDIRKYVIYKLGFFSKSKLGETEKPGFAFRGEKGKSYRIKIIAIDSTNLESEASEDVSIEVK